MNEQDSPSDNRLKSNWRTVAVVGIILLVGAVAGHSLLTNETIDVGNTSDNTSCQACPSRSTCALQDRAKEGTLSTDTYAVTQIPGFNPSPCACSGVKDSNNSETPQTSTTCAGQCLDCTLSNVQD